jgi:hypothetical protein
VCDLFVKPVTEDIAGLGSGAMVELVQEAEGFGLSKWGGCPTHMVSYSWCVCSVPRIYIQRVLGVSRIVQVLCSCSCTRVACICILCMLCTLCTLCTLCMRVTTHSYSYTIHYTRYTRTHTLYTIHSYSYTIHYTLMYTMHSYILYTHTHALMHSYTIY